MDEAFIQHIERVFPADFRITGQPYETLNRIINRLDIEKDARATTNAIPAGRLPYDVVMNSFFGKINALGFKQRLTQIENAIFSSEQFGNKAEKYSWLTKPTEGEVISILPPYINTVYPESGYNPVDIIPRSTSWSTPGSFIDKAPRQNSRNYFPSSETEIVIPSTIFTLLGFPEPITFKATIHANHTCSVRLDISENSIETIKGFASANLPESSMPDYFGGNSEKNFSIGKPTSDSSEILKYTIGKELSDLLQIIFAVYKMLDLQTSGIEFTNNCLFTTDDVVAARCRIMGMPVFVQDHSLKIEKNIHRAIFYGLFTSQDAKDRAYKENHLRLALENNSKILSDCKNILNKFQYVILGGQEKKINARFSSYILEISEKIREANIALRSLDIATIPLIEYKLRTNTFMAITFINEKAKINQSLRRLFPPTNDPSQQALDIVYTYMGGQRKTFGERTAILLSMRGGNTRSHKYKGGVRTKATFNTKTRTKLRSYFKRNKAIESNSPINLINHKYFLKSTCYKENSILRDFFLALRSKGLSEDSIEDFLYNIYNWLIYIDETPLDPNHLYSIYSRFNQDIDLISFKNMYESELSTVIRSTPLTPDEIDETIYQYSPSNF